MADDLYKVITSDAKKSIPLAVPGILYLDDHGFSVLLITSAGIKLKSL